MLLEPVPGMTLMRPRRLLDDGGDDALVLVVVERRRLAGGADRGQAVGPLLDVPVDQPAQGVEIDLAVLNGVTMATVTPANKSPREDIGHLEFNGNGRCLELYG